MAPWIVLGVYLLLAVGVRAQGTFTAFQPSPDSAYGVGYTANSTIGWQFSVSQGISVTSLGCYDAGESPGAPPTVEVGLWAGNGTVLASADVEANPDGESFASISPVLLQPGDLYFIGGCGLGETLVFSCPNNLMVAPQINPTGWGENQGGSGLSLPTTITLISFDESSQLPLADFQLQAAPEPTVLSLMSCAVIIFGTWHGFQTSRRRWPKQPKLSERN